MTLLFLAATALGLFKLPLSLRVLLSATLLFALLEDLLSLFLPGVVWHDGSGVYAEAAAYRDVILRVPSSN